MWHCPTSRTRSSRAFSRRWTRLRTEKPSTGPANLLRTAHGKIFTPIAAIRNNTRNTLVRQLATDTNQTVLDHITMLEKTGQVDFDSIANGTV